MFGKKFKYIKQILFSKITGYGCNDNQNQEIKNI